MKQKTLCNIKCWHEITEDMLTENGNSKILSLTINFNRELMIFFTKRNLMISSKKERSLFPESKKLPCSYFEVKIYKSSPEDHFVPMKNDNFCFYEENDNCVSIYFSEYDYAHQFISNLMNYHREFQCRPQVV